MSEDPQDKKQQVVVTEAEVDTEPPTPEVNEVKAKDPVYLISKVVLFTVACLFIWYIIADRHAPWSDQATVQAYVIPVVPQVSGRVTQVYVEKDQVVTAGDALFDIDVSDYQLAVENASSALAVVGQTLGAGVASVVSAQSMIAVAETNLEHIQAQSARVFELEKKGVFSKSEGDKARAAIKQGEAQVKSALAGLDKAKQALGVEGDQNPRIRSAMASLKKAQLDLSRTSVLAPSFGGITNLQIDTGYYANAGQPMMTFVEFDNVWLQANLRENNLANLKVGDPVDISLDVQPGTIYKGKVSSIGFAVNSSTPNAVGGLMTVDGTSGWLRESQRFPVTITFDNINEVPKGLIRLGGQADVQLYTGDNIFINGLAWLWIRAVSWLSYVY